jgi:hypothetical protein
VDTDTGCADAEADTGCADSEASTNCRNGEKVAGLEEVVGLDEKRLCESGICSCFRQQRAAAGLSV